MFSDVLSPPSGCGHSFVYAGINVFLDKQKCYKRQIWDFETIGYDVLRQNLFNIDYDNIVTNSIDIDHIYYKWHKEFREILKTSILNNSSFSLSISKQRLHSAVITRQMFKKLPRTASDYHLRVGLTFLCCYL